MVVRYRPVAAAAVTLLLLLPVPVFAAINFGSVTWTPTQDPFSPLFSSITVNDITNADPLQTHSILTFSLKPGLTDMGGTTTVTTTLSANNGDNVNANWANLDKLNVTNGQISVSITASNAEGTTGNMFSQAYTGPPNPGNPTITQAHFNKSTSTLITVTFTKSGFTTVGSPTGVAASFTLDFHN
jgi:hypothetical protein